MVCQLVHLNGTFCASQKSLEACSNVQLMFNKRLKSFHSSEINAFNYALDLPVLFK